MTLEQIVATHPCPIIRGKIMENVPKYLPNVDRYSLEGIILYAIDDWGQTKEGMQFWDKVHDCPTATYSDLKHLDKSCVPEPAKPAVMWRKIDKDNLPTKPVAAINRDEDSPQIYTGTLFYSDGIGSKNGIYIQSIGGYIRHYAFTHYIPLSELLNLPIEDCPPPTVF